MLDRLKIHLASPIFEDDEDRTRIAGLLNSVLLAMLVTGLIFVPIGALTKGGYRGVVIIMGTLTALAPVMLLLLRRGYVMSMSVLLVFLLFMASIGCVSIVGSAHVPVASLFIVCVVGAGLLLGHRGTVVVTVLSLIALFGLWWAETTGMLPPYRASGLAPFETHAALLLGTAVFLVLVNRNLNDILERARHGEQTFADRNRQMEAEITERKRAEEALRRSEQLNRSLVEHLPQRIFVKDRQSAYLSCNALYARDLGIEPAQIVGKDDFAFHPPELAEIYRADDQVVMETKKLKDIEEPYLVAGMMRWIHTIKVPYCDVEGHVTGVFGIFEDITDRKRIEGVLKESEERFQALARASFEGIAFTDGGVIIDANSQLAQMLGYDLSEIIGEPVAEMIVPEDWELVRQNIETGYEGIYENRLLRKDHSTLFAETQAKHFTYRGRNVRVTAVRDITERKQAEEALSLRESYLTAIIENQPGLVWLKDKESRFLAVNQTFARSCGMERPEEVLGKTDLDIWPRELAEKYRKDDKAVLTTGAHVSVEEAINDMGEMKWFETFKTPVLNKDGQILGTSGYAHDITERKRAEKALRESEEKYRELVEHANIIILHWTCDGLITFLNEFGQRFFGYSEAEILGQHVVGTIVPETESTGRDLRPLMDQICAAPVAFEYNVNENMRRNGERVWIAWTNKVELDHQNRVVRILSTGMNITERKRAEEALRESEELYRTLVSVSPDAISMADLNGLLTFTSPKALQMFGDSSDDDILGRSLLCWVATEEHEKVSANIRRLLTEGTLTDTEYTMIKKDGTRFIGEVNAAVIHSPDSKPMGIIVITRDVTERKREEEEKRKLEEQLFQAQKIESIGRLAGGVAHDFNNMLGVIIGRAEMALQQDVHTDKLQHNLKEILDAGLRSADLTRQLLAFARKQTAIPKILDLNDTISSMLKMLRRLIGEDIDLSWQPGLDLWKVKIDPSQVDQILANLAVNARDAISGVGSITLRAENVVSDDSNKADDLEFAPGENVLLTVSDTGAGMSKEVRENIFEPFFTTKEVGKGTGLGLSTVYGIVKQNDGFINVASAPGKGTTFKIYLPRFKAPTERVSIEQITVKRPTGTETILLVEDDEPILNLSRQILQELGYTVIAAQTPVQAVHLAEEHPGDIHLLITDVVMPEMNGRDLAEQLSALRPNLKRLYMSGYTANVIAHRGILDEDVGFIQKPFRSDDFAEKVRQVLEHE